jgi:hypothetical protein
MGIIRTIVMLPLGNSLFSSLRCPSQLAVPALMVFFLTASVTRIANKDGGYLAM